MMEVLLVLIYDGRVKYNLGKLFNLLRIVQWVSGTPSLQSQLETVVLCGFPSHGYLLLPPPNWMLSVLQGLFQVSFVH